MANIILDEICKTHKNSRQREGKIQ